MNEQPILHRNVEAERIVAAYFLRVDPSYVNKVDREYFTLYPCRLAYDISKARKRVMEKKTFISIIKTDYKSDIDDMKPFVATVYGEDIHSYSSSSIDEMLENIKYSFQVNEIVGGVGQIIDMAERGEKFDLDKARSILRSLSRSKVERKNAHSGEYLEDFEERLSTMESRINQSIDSGGLPGVTTGIDQLDYLTGGWMTDELVFIAAKTGEGKSVFVTNTAVAGWLTGYNIIMFSLEMRKLQIQYRIDSLLTSIAHSRFRLGSLDEGDVEKWKKRMVAFRASRTNYFEIIHLTSDVTVDAISEHIERTQDKYGSEAHEIIVDYMNLLYPPKRLKHKSPKDPFVQDENSWRLRQIAADLNGSGVPVITPVQLRDEANKAKILTPEHIKYSRGSGEHVGVMYGLKQTQDDQLDGVMQLQFMKCRDGKKYKPLRLRPRFDIMLINENRLGQFLLTEGTHTNEKTKKRKTETS
jgi:hypothetical protein